MVFVKKLILFPSIVLMQNGSTKRVLKSCKTKTKKQEKPIAEVSERKEDFFDYGKKRF